MKPSKCSVKEKNEARKAREEILLPAHSRTSQANMFHRDQKVAKCIACSRLSDSGEDAKEWGDSKEECTQKDGGTGKKKKEKKPFPLPFFFLFSCSRFLSTADPTISETGQAVQPVALYSQTMTRKPLD